MSGGNGGKHISRRRFLEGLALGAGSLGLSGCDPGSYIDYLTSDDVDRVNDRFNESMSGHAKPLMFPTATSEQFTFLWASDIHVTRDLPHHVDKLGFYAQQENAVFILHSGDCVDRGEEDEYQKWVRLFDKHSPVPVFTAIGNHDLYNRGWDRFKDYLGPSVFRFDYGQCDFTFLDLAAGTTGPDQMEWIKDILKKHRDKSCRFVFGHYPIYEGSFQTPSSMGYTQERVALMAMFDDYNVDYYLAGHKHCWAHEEVRGVDYIISGAGSAYKQVLNDDYHFLRFDVDGSQISKEKIYYEDVEIV